MKISGFIPSPEKASEIVSWTYSFASPDDEVEFLCYEVGLGELTQVAVKDYLMGSNKEASIVSIHNPMVVKEVNNRLRESKSELLVTSQFTLPEVDRIKQNSNELINSAVCRTFITLHGQKKPEEIKKILFVATGYLHDRPTLNLLNGFSKKNNSTITIVSVEDVTEVNAGNSSEQIIKSFIHDVGLDEESFEIKVVVDRLKHRGIQSCLDNHDLIVAGMDAESILHPLHESVSEENIAIVKRNPPLRFSSFVEWLPSINPEDHADLIYELRQGSIWRPDFIVMLALASAVSTLGLLQDSAAVVIGSMLLAPLMTPMMGLGLALAQANTKLMRLSIKSILLGFILTLSISFILGLLTPSGETLPQEVLARGTPNVLDLMIALFAACAAAFALARPNIIGAVAGVAIATALVPPACSVGISLAHGAYLNALGAALLFFANLIAIIAASSLTFTFLGITAKRSLRRFRRTALIGKISLALILLSLFAPMSKSLISKIEEGKNVSVAYPVTRSVSRAVMEKVSKSEGVEVMFLARGRSENEIIIHLASKENLPKSFADELREIVRIKMNDPSIPVRVVAVKDAWLPEEMEKTKK